MAGQRKQYGSTCVTTIKLNGSCDELEWPKCGRVRLPIAIALVICAATSCLLFAILGLLVVSGPSAILNVEVVGKSRAIDLESCSSVIFLQNVLVVLELALHDIFEGEGLLLLLR